MTKFKSFALFIIIMFAATTLNAKYLDDTLTDIFQKIKKSFTYYGKVVAVIPNRNEAVVQFDKFTPKDGIEVIVYREKGPIINQITSKIIGQIEDMIGIISLKETSGTVGLGDIIKHNGEIRAGDKVKYSKRVIFRLKSVENLSDKPEQAYNIKSYLELAISNFPAFELIDANTPIKNTQDVYIVNLKVFVKDSSNPENKRISLKVYSSYTNFSIGLYSGEFTMSKKMLQYKAPVVAQKSQVYSGTGSNLPVYPMGPQVQAQPMAPQYPAYPSYPNMQGNVKFQPKPFAKYPLGGQGANIQKPSKISSKYKFSTFDNLKPSVTRYRKIAQVSEKLKTLDFYKNQVVYSDGSSIIYGKMLNNSFKKLSGDLYKGFGNIIGTTFVDVDNDGKMEIAVNILSKDDMNSRIYKIKNDRMILIGRDYSYIFGNYDFNDDGKEEFAAQSFDQDDIFGRQLFKMKLVNGDLKKIKTNWIPYGFRITSSVKADLDGDGKKEIIFINEQHRLMVYKNGEKIYTGDDSLGGSLNTAVVNLGTEKFEYDKARAIDVKPVKFMKDKKGKEGVLIVKNYATLDAFLGDVGLFKKGELKLVYINSFGDVGIKTYSGQVDGAIEGFTIYNNEIVCGIIKKSAVNPLAAKAQSYFVAFPEF